MKEAYAHGEARVLLPGVECPSLSPDNTQIAFKRNVTTKGGGWWGWQVWVLQLSNMSQRRLTGQTRSIDDQVDWLDDTHLVYFDPRKQATTSA